MAPLARPAAVEHVKDVPLPEQVWLASAPLPESKDTPVGNVPEAMYPPLLSLGPPFWTVTA